MLLATSQAMSKPSGGESGATLRPGLEQLGVEGDRTGRRMSRKRIRKGRLITRGSENNLSFTRIRLPVLAFLVFVRSICLCRATTRVTHENLHLIKYW